MIISVPAGRFADSRGPIPMLAGALLLAIAFAAFATGSLPLLALGFILGGIAIGCAEMAQHAAVAALAPTALRGSAFGLLRPYRALGNLPQAQSRVFLWALVSRTITFGYLAACMLVGTITTVLSTSAADPL
jgi:hypothetical protein